MSAVYEKEKLAYRLLEGESAKRLERPGASLRYSVLPCAGEKVGTVIFLHGVASNGSRWEEFIEKTSLKQAFDILRCDLRGHAASVSSRQARLEDWCGDVAAILQAEGVAKAVVVGHSLGAQVAVNFAAKYADCVLGGVLLDPLISEALTPKALEILSSKKKGGYNVVQIDSEYEPVHEETKDVFGVTFSQGRNDFKIDYELLANVVTDNKDIPEDARRDLVISLITLKYTQSNSVCYAYDGQAIGVGAGQQSRIHCTRLAGGKADTWHLRQSPRVLELPFKPGLGRADRDNVIDGFINKNEEDVTAEGVWQKYFTERPAPFTYEEQRAYLDTITGVSLGSDAFFPFGDNIERAAKSGVKYVAQPGGSVRDQNVIDTCNKYGMAMAFTGMRLFHH